MSWQFHAFLLSKSHPLNPIGQIKLEDRRSKSLANVVFYNFWFEVEIDFRASQRI